MWLIVFFVGACSGAGGETPDAGTDLPVGPSKLGINLAAINYYATQTPFIDVFRGRDAWATTDGIAFDTQLADTVPVDADGYPLEIPYEGQMFRASVLQPFSARRFTLTWQGDGDVAVTGPGLSIESTKANTIVFTVKASGEDAIFVQITRSSKADHVRGIQVVGPASLERAFAGSLQGFEVLRFMDWAQTNGNPISSWRERTTANQAQGSDRGAAIETMIETANSLHGDLWYSVPHKADDSFIQQAAALIKSKLASDLRVYVEYSNENWNSVFSQVDWEQEQGVALGLDASDSPDDDEGSKRYDAGLKFSVRRAARVHTTFRAVLGAARVVAVLGGQSASPELNNRLLDFYADSKINPLGGKPDVLAVAPYFGKIYTRDDKVDKATVDTILDDTEALIATSVGDDTRMNRKVADDHEVELIAYEAGQHLLAAGGLEDDDDFVQLLLKANRSPRMGELYRKAHAAWLKSGGGLAVYFNSCEQWSKFGSWGALEYQDQPIEKAYKMAALRALATAK